MILSGRLEDRIQLIQGWRYQPGDDPAWADPAYDDSGWPVISSSLQIDEEPPGGWPGIGWFRRRLQLADGMPATAVAFRVEQIGASEVYLDGRLVGRTGTVSADPGAERPVYPNDFGGLALEPGRTHLLAVRYSNSRGNLIAGNALGFAVNIRSVESAAASYAQWSRIVITMPSAFAGAFGALAVLHLLLFAFRRTSREHLFFALFAASVVTAFCLEMAGEIETDLVARLVTFKLQVAVTVAMVLLGLVLVHVVFRKPASWTTWLVAVGGLGITAWVASWTAFLSPAPIRVFFVIAFLEMLRISLLALRRRVPDAWIVAAAFALMAATTLLTATLRAVGRPLNGEIAGNASLAVVAIAFSLFISRRAARTARELEQRLTEVRTLSERAVEQERRALQEESERRILEAENRRRNEELDAARRLQLAMLPQSLPETPGLDIAYRMVTATEVGGDYVDLRIGDGGRGLLAVGDATSHGLQAGMVVAVAKSIFQGIDPAAPPVEVLRSIDAGLQTLRERHASMAMVVVAREHDRFDIASAGMPPVLIRSAATGQVEEVLLPGVPLGTIAHSLWQSHAVRLRPGDTLLLVSDGVVEAVNPAREPFGFERVAGFLTGCAGLAADRVVDRLFEEVTRFSCHSHPLDDITAVAVVVR